MYTQSHFLVKSTGAVACSAFRTCIDECFMGVLEMDNDKAYAVHASVCIGCFKCREFCPNHAIQTRWIMRA